MNMLQAGEPDKTYLPAAGHDIFLPFYDWTAKLLGADRARESLLHRLSFQPGNQVLDLGCGTGTFATHVKQHFPTAEIVGLDPDPKALARARRKAERAHLSIHFDQGFGESLPYPQARFDAVFSSFMFHHLQEQNREKALCEVHRVLKPGGMFYLMDFEVSQSSGHGFFCIFHSTERLHDNTEPRILYLLSAAGFSQPHKIETYKVFFGLGRAACFRASA